MNGGRAFLTENNIPVTPSALEQLEIFSEALHIFAERNARYKDQWKQFGWRGTLHDMRKKMSRLYRVFTAPDSYDITAVDDALDLINYTAFFLRDMRASNENGDEHDSY